MKLKVFEYWWEDDDLILVTEDGTWVCKNAYPSSISFGGLDYDSTEAVIV